MSYLPLPVTDFLIHFYNQLDTAEHIADYLVHQEVWNKKKKKFKSINSWTVLVFLFVHISIITFSFLCVYYNSQYERFITNIYILLRYKHQFQ